MELRSKDFVYLFIFFNGSALLFDHLIGQFEIKGFGFDICTVGQLLRPNSRIKQPDSVEEGW